MRCILDGQTTEEMARNLGVQRSTARTHVQNLLTKLGVHSRLQVAALMNAGRMPNGRPVPQDRERPPARAAGRTSGTSSIEQNLGHTDVAGTDRTHAPRRDERAPQQSGWPSSMTTRSSPTRWRAGSGRRATSPWSAPPARRATAAGLLKRHPVDVIALDLDLAGEDGLRLGREILAAWPDIGIVVVTGAAEEVPRVLEAVQMGVPCWVDKADTADTLVAANRVAGHGESRIPAEMLTKALMYLSAGGPAATPEQEAIGRLTHRERDVLYAPMDGLSRTQIGASRSKVSPNTVRTHVQSILSKLTRLLLCAWCRRPGAQGRREPRVRRRLTPPVRERGSGRHPQGGTGGSDPSLLTPSGTPRASQSSRPARVPVTYVAPSPTDHTSPSSLRRRSDGAAGLSARVATARRRVRSTNPASASAKV